MWSEKEKAIMQAKIDARHYSRELIKAVFQATEHFPQNDPDFLASALRKKALSVSSLLSHGTTKSDFEEQNQDFMLVMTELREVLKLITITTHLGFSNANQKAAVREHIAQVINSLDMIVLLQQGHTPL